MDDADVVLDCDAGRRRGCATFCCRLLVRLEPGERAPVDTRPEQRCIDKDPATGLCVYFDEAARGCTVWASRPRVCREYDCNHDPLLQKVLRDGFESLTRLVRAPFAGPARQSVPPVDSPVLVRLRRRFDDAPPEARVGDVERGLARELAALRQHCADALGGVRACAQCSRQTPSGVAQGGACCSDRIHELFDDAEVAAHRAAGADPGEFRGGQVDPGQCGFCGPRGCMLPAARRPSACLAYLCDDLQAELRERGDLDEVLHLTELLAQHTERFRAARALREAAEELERLLA